MSSSRTRASILEDFPPHQEGDWRAEAERLLRGVPFDRALQTPLREGFALSPIYHRRDLPEKLPFRRAPGFPPFPRGTRSWRQPSWWIAQEQEATTLEEAAATLREELATGLQVVHLVLDSEVDGGLPLHTATELDTLLGEAALASTPIILQTGNRSLKPLELLVGVARRRGVETTELQGAIAADPAGAWARRGDSTAERDASFDELAETIRRCEDQSPLLGVWWCHGEIWHEAGADAARELGLALATIADSLRALEERGIPPLTAARHLRWSFAVGSNFFVEVAKLRIARALLHAVLGACGAAAATVSVRLHARTSRRTRTTLDPHTNLLRAATEAFSAVMGGADSLHVDGFTHPAAANDPFARRLARFQQIILREEARLGAVLDPAGGSWAVEALSAELGRGAWEFFRDVEGHGGLFQALQTGWVQEDLQKEAEERLQEVAKGQRTLVGVNRYPLPDELRSSTTSSTPPRPSGLSGSSGLSSDRGMKPLHRIRLAESFETLRAKVERARAEGRDLAAFVLPLDPLPSIRERLDFITSFFRVGGFGVELPATPDQVVAALEEALRRRAPVTVLCGRNGNDLQRAEEVARRLRENHPEGVVAWAGRPRDDALVRRLEDAGVSLFLHPGIDHLQVLDDLAASGEGKE